MEVAIYKISNNKISRFITCHPSIIDIQCESDEDFFLNCPVDATHIIDGEAVVQLSAPTEFELREIAKENRAKAVASIIVTTASGKAFDGDESSQTRMARAIIGMEAIGRVLITWTLADNSIVDVSAAELTEALVLAGERQSQLWPIT